jgi:hypothetical protein
VFITKLVELEILKISYLGNFSSSYSKSKVIWQKPFEFENGGECYSARRITVRQRTAWAPASRWAAPGSFSRAPGPPARCLAPSSDRHCGRAYKYVELTVAFSFFSVLPPPPPQLRRSLLPPLSHHQPLKPHRHVRLALAHLVVRLN